MNGIQNIIKQNEILIDLLVNVYSENQALRNYILKNDAESIESFKKDADESRAFLMAQIKSRYFLDEGPDDILKSAFQGD